MPHSLNQDLVTRHAQRMCRSRHVHGAALSVHHPDAGTFTAACGNLNTGSLFFAASVTKLLVTIVVMRLVEAERIALDDPLSRHLPSDLIAGLHVLDGVDRSGQITIRNLISAQSGLQDYFSLKREDGRTNMDALLAGEDTAWPLERTIETVRGLKPAFLPGQKGKASYSDTNYQLLGRILETITGQELAALFAAEIFDPLGLQDTYIYTDPLDTRPAPIHSGPNTLHLPKYMASITAEGGMISTGSDLVRIGRAVFDGQFFDITGFLARQDWRMLWWPGQFHFGLGLERLWTPWFYSPLRPVRDVLGFWGQTGAFLFHHLHTGLTFGGTVNQASGWGHASAVRAMLRIITAMPR